MKRKGISPLVAGLGLLVVLLGFGLVSGNLSVGAGPGDEADNFPDIPDNIEGEDANVDAKAQDVADSSQPNVAAPVDLYAVDGDEEFINTATTNKDGSRVSISGLSVTESFAAYYAVGNSSFYGDRDPATEGDIVDAKTVRSEGEVYTIAASGDADVSIYDNSDSDVSGGSVTVGSGETYNFEKIRARADGENIAWNVEYVYVNDTQLSNVDEWRLDGATKMDSVPEHLSDDYSVAFRLDEAGDLTAGEAPTLEEFDKIEPGQLALDMEDGNDPSGDVQVAVDDAAMFKNDAEQVEQGSEDSSDNDVGLAEQTVTVTIN